MTARELIRYRRLGAARFGHAGRWGRVVVALASFTGAMLLFRQLGPASAASKVEAAYWSGAVLACLAGFLSLDRGLLSEEPLRLVAWGVEPSSVARYHLFVAAGAMLEPTLLTLLLLSPWWISASLATAVQMLLLLIIPTLTSALVGLAAHARAGEALDGEHARRFRKLLAGRFGDAQVAPLLYSGSTAFAAAAIGAVLLQAGLRDAFGGRGLGPLGVVLLGHLALLGWALHNTLSCYRRSLQVIVPLIAEVTSPQASRWGDDIRPPWGSSLLDRLPQITGAVALRDLHQVRRAHRLDIPLRIAFLGSVALWLARAPERSFAIIALIIGWAVVVAFLLPNSARALAPSLAPPWLQHALALSRSGQSFSGGLIAAQIFDLPLLVGLTLLVGVLLDPLASVVVLLGTVLFGWLVHALGRRHGMAAGRATAAVLGATALALSLGTVLP